MDAFAGYDRWKTAAPDYPYFPEGFDEAVRDFEQAVDAVEMADWEDYAEISARFAEADKADARCDYEADGEAREICDRWKEAGKLLDEYRASFAEMYPETEEVAA